MSAGTRQRNESCRETGRCGACSRERSEGASAALNNPGAREARALGKEGGRELSAFGLTIESDFALPGAEPAAPGRDLALRFAGRDELEALAAEPRVLRYLHLFDDCPYAMLEGPDGNMLICYGHRAIFHLSTDGRVLRCAPTERNDPIWQRVLLDTVLWTVSLLRGYEQLHASAVRTANGVVAFTAASGGGKTSLAAEFLRRGAALYTDDILALEQRDGVVVAHRGPALMNLPRSLVPEIAGEANVLADFGEEQWVQVQRPALSAEPLAAVVIVARAAGLDTHCVRAENTALALLAHLVGFPYLERERTRFELYASLASTTPVLELTADLSVPTAELADLVAERVASL